MENESYVDSVINIANQYQRFFSKFISANDAGLTGGHQEGIYLSKNSWPLFFDSSGHKDENKDRFVNVYWQEGYPPVKSRLIWYGNKTRSEYRITRFWADSPYDKKECVGDLLVLVLMDTDNIFAALLKHEEEIEAFLNHFQLSLTRNVGVYGAAPEQPTKVKLTEEEIIHEYVSVFGGTFPASPEMAKAAREINDRLKRTDMSDSDKSLIRWIDTEYRIFQTIEEHLYTDTLTKGFKNVDELVQFASSVLNRRKSRAGKSLEHHVDCLLTAWNIPFSHPGKSEGNKKPDFLFPSNEAYANFEFDDRLLTFLGAKTTCKDRWRQILNEANRTPAKHLITLQQGISENQLQEMKDEHVLLVVPKIYHPLYPPKFQADLLDVNTFLGQLKTKYEV